jgi:citrate synthase
MRTMSATEAAAELAISTATLYAYVSRGQIRSVTSDTDRREKRYLVEDVERIKSRRISRRPTAPGSTPAWMLETSLTSLDGGELRYRGRDATALARNSSVGDVAALLWTGDAKRASQLFASRAHVPASWSALAKATSDLSSAERMQILLIASAEEDPSAWDLRPAAAARTGAAILQIMTESVAGKSFEASTGISEGLASCWAPGSARVVDVVRAGLILAADRELDLPSYTARAIAAAGSTPYAAVAGALSAFRGVRHGGLLARIDALLTEVSRPGDAVPVIRGRLERGESVPGFGHRHFPDADPRAAALIGMLDATAKSSKEWSRASRLISAADELIDERPTFEFALTAVARAMGLPPEASSVILAIGRSIGWVAHTIEEYGNGQVEAPPARYVGE